VTTVRIIDIIAKKRDGKQLDEKEIIAVVKGYTDGELPDYQMAAFLMAVYFRGMTNEETSNLTLAMANSGQIIDLSDIPGVKVDKHSTGGVADTTTLVLGPLVASVGIPVAKMSGRGLGFTGGTIDKLESIPGFRTTLSKDEFITNLKRHSIALTSQNKDIAPADGKIYALRDSTATVESIPLISSSIMSKKIAAGADKILLDVKVGSGAFMKDLPSAVKLASTMVEIGKSVGRETCAIITNMDEPLGYAVGNSLEIKEAIETLKGNGPEGLQHLCLLLGSHMMKLAGCQTDLDFAYSMLMKNLKNGQALAKFKEFIKAQSGNAEVVDNQKLLPFAEFQIELESSVEGYVQAIDAAKVGYAAMLLGAGREHKEQAIDLAAGIMMKCRVGSFVKLKQPLAELHTNSEARLEAAKMYIIQAIKIDSKRAAPSQLILGIVDKNGYRKY